jgi:hypothetical protein
MTLDEQPFVTAIEGFIGQSIPRAALPDFPYRTPPVLQSYKPAASHHFRLRRTIARSSGLRFRR